MVVLWVALVATLVLGGGAGVALEQPRQNGRPIPGLCATAAWRPVDLPVLVTLDPVDADLAADVAEAVAWWEERAPGLLLEAGLLNPALAGGSIVSVREVAPDSRPGRKVVATTPLKARGCEIVGAEIRLAPGLWRWERKRAIAHELGHVLGLADDDDMGSVMSSYTDRGPFDLPEATARRLSALYPRASRR